MRAMAFDYGTKRIGIAVTDPLRIIATGLTTVHPREVFSFLENYLRNEEVSLFVVGDPRQMDSSPSESAGEVNGFVKRLRKKFPSIPVERMDERFTSKMASRAILEAGAKKTARRNKELIDKVSATILLQDWLNKNDPRY